MLRLKELRKEQKLSQKDVAKIVNYSQHLVSAWELGHREPNIDALIKLARYFNVTIDYLVGKSAQNNAKILDVEVKYLSELQIDCIASIIGFKKEILLQAKCYLDGLKEATKIYKKN